MLLGWVLVRLLGIFSIGVSAEFITRTLVNGHLGLFDHFGGDRLTLTANIVATRKESLYHH